MPMTTDITKDNVDHFLISTYCDQLTVTYISPDEITEGGKYPPETGHY